MSELQLGKLVEIFYLSPVFKQRALVVAAISFAFFTVMVVGFLARPGFVFVLLGTAFLVIEIFTLFGWFALRRAELRFYETGFTYRKIVCRWSEIASVDVKTEISRISGAKTNCLVRKNDGREIILTDAIADLPRAAEIIRAKVFSSANL